MTSIASFCDELPDAVKRHIVRLGSIWLVSNAAVLDALMGRGIYGKLLLGSPRGFYLNSVVGFYANRSDLSGPQLHIPTSVCCPNVRQTRERKREQAQMRSTVATASGAPVACSIKPVTIQLGGA